MIKGRFKSIVPTVILVGTAFLCSSEIRSQSNYERAEQLYEEGQFQEANSLYLKAIEEVSSDSVRAYCFRQLSDYYLNNSNYDSSDFYIQKSMEIAESLGDSLMIADLYMDLNYQYHFQGLTQPAQEYILKAEPIFEKLGDKSKQAEALVRIGTIQFDMGNDSLMEIYMDKAIEIQKALSDENGLSLSYQSMGHFYSTYFQETGLQKYYQEAKKYQLQAIEMNRKLGKVIPTANCLNSLASLMIYTEQPDSGLVLLLESLEMTKQAGSGIGQTWNYFSIAEAYETMGDKDMALLYLDSCAAAAEEFDILDAKSSSSGYKAQIHYDLGNYKEAFENLQMYEAYNDTIYNNENYQQMSELQEEFNSIQQQQEILELEHLAEIEKTKKRWMTICFIGLILLSFLILNREIKRRKKAGELLLTEKKLRESEETRLKEQIDYKNRELTSMALQMAQKNDMLSELQEELEKETEKGTSLKSIENRIRVEAQMDNFWEQFSNQFTETHPQFFMRLKNKNPELTRNELRLSALIKMNLSNKEVASILNVSDEAVKKARYRLKKKLDLEEGENIEGYLMAI